ncbi:MAG: sensor histidine kinase, partial [Alphaproteobacteria bacterium]
MWPLSRRMPLIALALAALLLVVGVAMAIYSERSYREQKTREIGAQGKILASTVAAALLFDDDRAAQEYVNALAENPDILAAAVYDARGAFVAGYLRSPVLEISSEAERGPPRFEDNHVIVTIPVLANGEDVGTVYLRALTEPVERRWLRYGAVGLLIFMVSLVVVVMGVAHAALSRANAELARRAANLAELNADLETQIVERQRAEEALRHSQKLEAIGQLSGGIAHDFNNLLAVIQGSLQLLQRRIGQGRTDVGKYVEMAMEGLSRAASLTQRILAFSRRHPLSPKPVDLSRLVLGMNVLLSNSVGDNIAIEWRLEADWWTFCDPHQMENVVLNLAINARDAMPDGGSLTIETENVTVRGASVGGPAPGDYVMLAVADTGTGMSDEVREKAFDPFFT